MKLCVMVVLQGEDAHPGMVFRVRLVLMMVVKVEVGWLGLPSQISCVLQAWDEVEGNILITK